MIGLPDRVRSISFAPIEQIKLLRVGFGALMSQGHQRRGQVMDNRIDEAIARWRQGVLMRQCADLTIDGTYAERWSAEGQAFDELPQGGVETMVPAVATSLAHQARQALSAVALHPACQRPERQRMLVRNLGQRDVLVEEGAYDLEARDGPHALLVGQRTQR